MVQDGYVYDSGSATVKHLWAQLGLEQAKLVQTPATKSTTRDEVQPLTGEEHTEYRSALGKELYIGHDHPIIQFAASQAARSCAAPTREELHRVRRIARFLKKAPVFRWHFKSLDEPTQIAGYSDSD